MSAAEAPAPAGGGAASLSAYELRYSLLITDEAIEAVGGDTPQFAGRERLNKGLGAKGLHRAGEPDPWKRSIAILKAAGLVATTPSSGTFVLQGTLAQLRSELYAALEARPEDEVRTAEGAEFPSRRWVPPAIAPAMKRKSGAAAPRPRPVPSPAPRPEAKARAAPPPPAPVPAPPPLTPAAAGGTLGTTAAATGSAEVAPTSANVAATAPSVSRERINAAMHAICASLAAAAATGVGAGGPHPGSLDEATLHHAALSTPVARGAPGGGLDAATLGAVLRAVANRRVGDLVIRGFEDTTRPGLLRFSLHDLGGAHEHDSAEAAEAADALIAVARTASEEAGAGAVAPGAAAAGTEAAGALRPGPRAQRAAAVKRHYATMAAGLSEGEPDERSDGRPKRRSGGPGSRRVASPAAARGAPAYSGGEAEAAAALGDLQLFLEDLRDELALKNADIARELAACRRDVRAQGAALDRLVADVAAMRGLPPRPATLPPEAPPFEAAPPPPRAELEALKAELAALRALITAGAAGASAGAASGVPPRAAGSPGPSPLGLGARPAQQLPPATDAAGVARRAAQMLTAMPAAVAQPAWQPYGVAPPLHQHQPLGLAAPNAAAADEGAKTLAAMASGTPPPPGAPDDARAGADAARAMALAEPNAAPAQMQQQWALHAQQGLTE